MIYTELTNKAMRLAYTAHHAQTDKAGQPYIFHPYHLAEQMPDEISVCVALLHDVVEDTSVEMETLEQEFPWEVTYPLRLLTREKGTDYFDYIRAVKKDPVARRVKLADLEHNSDLSRLEGCFGADRKKLSSLQKRYAKAKEILLEDGETDAQYEGLVQDLLFLARHEGKREYNEISVGDTLRKAAEAIQKLSKNKKEA